MATNTILCSVEGCKNEWKGWECAVCAVLVCARHAIRCECEDCDKVTCQHDVCVQDVFQSCGVCATYMCNGHAEDDRGVVYCGTCGTLVCGACHELCAGCEAVVHRTCLVSDRCKGCRRPRECYDFDCDGMDVIKCGNRECRMRACADHRLKCSARGCKKVVCVLREACASTFGKCGHCGARVCAAHAKNARTCIGCDRPVCGMCNAGCIDCEGPSHHACLKRNKCKRCRAHDAECKRLWQLRRGEQ